MTIEPCTSHRLGSLPPVKPYDHVWMKTILVLYFISDEIVRDAAESTMAQDMICKEVFAAMMEMGSTVPRSISRGDAVLEGV